MEVRIATCGWHWDPQTLTNEFAASTPEIGLSQNIEWARVYLRALPAACGEGSSFLESIINLLISFLSSTMGAVCGIGGGIIIKPVLDAVGLMEPSAIHFLSGCTVLAMTFYAVLSAKVTGTSLVDRDSGTPIAVGAAVGGILGKLIFQALLDRARGGNFLILAQGWMLLLLTVGTLIYSLKKDKIPTRRLSGWAAGMAVGGALGLVSAFLGIGGGPFNLVVLHYFFSMPTKTAVQNSLYIILFSQLASLLNTLVSGTVPAFSAAMLLLMAAGGVAGGIGGRALNKRLDDARVSRLFVGLLVVIIGINAYNIVKYF